MPKNIVVAILEKKHFYDKDSISRSQMMEMESPLMQDVSQPYAAPSPLRHSLNRDEFDRGFEPPKEPLLPKKSLVG